MSLTFEMPGDKVIYTKEHVRSTLLAKLREKAPDLTDQFLEIFQPDGLEDGDNVDLKELDEEQKEEYIQKKQDEAEQEGVQSMFDGARKISMEVKVDELQALHDFCAEVTERVEGFPDLEDDEEPLVWKNLEESKRPTFYDVYVPSSVKLMIFMETYLLKMGIMPKEDLEADEEEEGAGADDPSPDEAG